MKTIKQLLMTVAVLLCNMAANAHDFEVDGIYYNIVSATDLTVGVTCKGDYSDDYANEYTGNVIIPSTVTYGTKALTVVSIDYEAFKDCSELTSLTIPNSVINIGKRAFYRCYGLRSVTIPNSVTSIGEDAFMDCNGLTRVELDCSEIGHWFYSLAVDDSAPIKEFVFGNNVTSIKQRFSYFKQLTSIYLLGKTPPSIENDRFMESQYVKTTLYVPQGSLETFQSADTWKNFWDIREHNMTGINEISAGDITIEATANGISVLGAEGNTIVIHAANGTRVVNIDSYVGEEITLDRGVYIVRVGSNTLKVKL